MAPELRFALVPLLVFSRHLGAKWCWCGVWGVGVLDVRHIL